MSQITTRISHGHMSGGITVTPNPQYKSPLITITETNGEFTGP